MEETKEEVKQESGLNNSGDSSEYEYYEEVETPEPSPSFEQQRDSIKQDVMKQATEMMKDSYELK